ncbi:MAG: hypothetical protein ACI9EF_002667 [Pseudohongiellaceae bacterium]|jgi:hypothetical protein
MIDQDTSAFVPLSEVADLLPRHRGRPIHISTVYRWVQQGVHGVRLSTARIGGRLYTSREALHQFMAQLSGDDGPGGSKGAVL